MVFGPLISSGDSDGLDSGRFVCSFDSGSDPRSSSVDRLCPEGEGWTVRSEVSFGPDAIKTWLLSMVPLSLSIDVCGCHGRGATVWCVEGEFFLPQGKK